MSIIAFIAPRRRSLNPDKKPAAGRQKSGQPRRDPGQFLAFVAEQTLFQF